MSNPKISIIIPVYNVEAYLPKCLDSVLSQTFTDFEVICVNDGSPDHVSDILEEYANKDSRLVVISQENFGASVARNNALDRATGDYIMFVDADDWIDKETCEIAYQAATEHNADVVLWDYVREFAQASKPKNIFDNDKLFDREAAQIIYGRMIGLYKEELSAPENADALCTIWGKLYRRNLISNYGIRFYDIRKIDTFEDGLFNLDVFAYVNKAVYLHKHLSHYRKTNEGSVTSKYKADLQKKHEHLHAYLQSYITKHHLQEQYQTRLQNRIALELVGYGLNILKLPKDRVKAVRSILKNPYYKTAYIQLEIKYMPLHWKVFYTCARFGFATGVYALLVCIKKIIER